MLCDNLVLLQPEVSYSPLLLALTKFAHHVKMQLESALLTAHPNVGLVSNIRISCDLFG